MHITRYLECRPLNNNYICLLLEYEIISRDNVHMFVIPTKSPPPKKKLPKATKTNCMDNIILWKRVLL